MTLVAHFEEVIPADREFRIRLYQKSEQSAEEQFQARAPYVGTLVISISDGIAAVSLASGAFDFRAYAQLRDALFNTYHVDAIEWDGNGRIQRPKKRKNR